MTDTASFCALIDASVASGPRFRGRGTGAPRAGRHSLSSMRSRLRGSTTVPRWNVQTSPLSRHAVRASTPPACAARWARSAVSMTGGGGTVRRDRPVLGSAKTSAPPTRCTVDRGRAQRATIAPLIRSAIAATSSISPAATVMVRS